MWARLLECELRVETAPLGPVALSKGGGGKGAVPLLESVVGFAKRARDRECPHLSRQLHVTTLVRRGRKTERGAIGGDPRPEPLRWGGPPGPSP